MSQDIFANASLFLPEEPQSLEDLDINSTIIEGLILKVLASRSSITAGELADFIDLPYYNVVEPIIDELREGKMIDVMHGGMQAISYRLSITDQGRARANAYFDQSAYMGPAPVSIEVYANSVTAQTIRNIQINKRRLLSAFEGLIFDEDILRQIGPATNSGESLFLYGPPGNGKTSVAERIVEAFGGGIFIPYAVEVNGAIIRLYDEYNHQLIDQDDIRLNQRFDKRWRLIKRPVIIVGGELTMESLDLIWSEESRFYEAPFQMKANGGCFMIDDFGRQRMNPHQLLNRWIVPLEKKVDFLTLHTGIKVAMLFDVLLVISTNLDPSQLVDEAFLRRLRYKVPINDPSPENFKAIWQLMSEIFEIPYSDEVVDYFITKHMTPYNRPLRCCLPRDILQLVLDQCRFNQTAATISPELIDLAAESYFVNLDNATYTAAVVTS